MTAIYRLTVGIGIGSLLLSSVLPVQGSTSSDQLGATATASAHWLAQLPSNLGHPTRGTRRGGASRGGSCELPAGEPPLTALMPADPNAEVNSLAPESVISLTYRAEPELWFYMPYTLDRNSQVDFVLKNVAGDTLHQARLNTEGLASVAPGIVQVSLAELEIALMPETGYHWYLTVRCDVGGAVSVDGWLHQRQAVPITYATPETEAEAVELAADYEASQGFWTDSLSTLQRGLQDEPSSELLQQTWRSLLVEEGLADIADRPIQDCCEFMVEP